MPRVLVVQDAPESEDDVEWAVAADGEHAIFLALHEDFDAVIVDLDLAPLDGWCVLATLGSAPVRPRLIAFVTKRGEIERARTLGADLCVLAGTPLHARALQPTWQRHQGTNCRRAMTSGVSV